MAYTAGIPQPTDNISSSQAQLLGNFNALDSIFGQDHTAFSANTNGDHKQLTFSGPTTPVPTPVGTVANLYDAAPTSQQELMWVNASATTQVTAAGNPIWKGGSGATASLNANDGIAALNASSSKGSLLLPNGILLNWGTFSGVGPTVVYQTPYVTDTPFLSSSFSSIPGNFGGISTTTKTAASFTNTNGAGSVSGSFFAIGRI